jgi:hypothetical protein
MATLTLQKFDWASGNLDYMGGNAIAQSVEGDENWFLWKFTWDDDGNLTDVKGPVVGSWTNRARAKW